MKINLVDYSCKYYYSWTEENDFYENSERIRIDNCKNEFDLKNKITEIVKQELDGLNYSDLKIEVTDIKRIEEKINNCWVHTTFIERLDRYVVLVILANQVVWFGYLLKEELENFKDKAFILDNILNPDKLNVKYPPRNGENVDVNFNELEEDIKNRNFNFYTEEDAKEILTDGLKKRYQFLLDKKHQQDYFGLDV